MIFSHKLLKDIVAWDIHTWSKGILFWDEILDKVYPISTSAGDAAHIVPQRAIKALDIGAGKGGVSLFLGLKGFDVTCSDKDQGEKTETARVLHKEYKISDRITYEVADATRLSYADGTFDVVAFKSALGGIGRNKDFTKIRAAMDEIYRVLKPGGVLLFCENLEATWLHGAGRRLKGKGNSWNYLSLAFIEELLGGFAEHDIRTRGFLNCFVQDNALVGCLDGWLCSRIKPHRMYMCYGWARK